MRFEANLRRSLVATEIDIVGVEQQPLVAVRGTLAMGPDMPAKLLAMTDKVWAFIRGNDIREHGHNVWMYRPRADGTMDVETGVQVAAPFVAGGEIVRSSTPAGKAAHLVYYGEYTGLPAAHLSLMDWCAENGHARAGVNWEVYGDWQEDPAKRRADVYHLLH